MTSECQNHKRKNRESNIFDSRFEYDYYVDGEYRLFLASILYVKTTYNVSIGASSDYLINLPVKKELDV